jgi:sulfate/thiosulfate transport system substrate-binding protein
MSHRRLGVRLLGVVAVLALLAAACSSSSARTAGDPSTSNVDATRDCSTAGDSPVVNLAAYSNVYAAYGKLISTFQAEWKEEQGQSVIFSTSFGGSTTQAQSVVAGLPADVVALSLDPDVQLIADAGLITHDWKSADESGIVGTSAVVFDVRPGNPKNIENWDDLTQPGLQILTPDPAESGGARWNIVAAYGAAMRGEVPGYEKGNQADAQRLLEDIFKNVTVMDKSANDSIKNFEAGNGDVAINYEYAVIAAQQSGLPDEMVIPPSTVAIETPVAVVDANAEAHCVEDVATAFVDWLHTDEAKEIFADVGYERPVDVRRAAKGDGDMFAPIGDLFTTDDIGGWDGLGQSVFGADGAFTKAQQAVQG